MQMHSSKNKNSSAMSDINITPFVDVMLVLLVVFMVTAPLMVAGVNVDLPNSSASSISSDDEPLSISIDRDGKVYIQNTEINVNDLSKKLIAMTGEKFDSRIFVRGDKNVDYGKIMNVVGAINEAGFNKVSLLTEVNN